MILTKALKLSSLYFALIFGIPLVFFSIVLFYFYFIPPQEVILFPLDDPQGTYTITYRYKQYALGYEGSKSALSHTAYILDSPIDLKPHINKKVIITGNFISSDKQCIMKQCTQLSTKWLGIRIKTIKLHD